MTDLAFDLIVRFLRLRWWDTVTDLLDATEGGPNLSFDELEVERDLRELERALPRADLVAFVIKILDRELPIEFEARLSAAFPGLDEGRVRNFLTLMALNLALFGVCDEAFDAVIAHLRHGPHPRWSDGAALGRALARAFPEVLARQRLEAAFPEGDPLRIPALESCHAELYAPRGLFLHLFAERPDCERAVSRLLAEQGLTPCPWELPQASFRLIGFPMVGRAVSFAVAGDAAQLSTLTRRLSRKSELGAALWVDHARPTRLEHFSRGRLQGDAAAALAALRARLGPNAALGDEDRALLGILLELGVRIYDRSARTAHSGISFDELAPLRENSSGIAVPASPTGRRLVSFAFGPAPAGHPRRSRANKPARLERG